MGVKDFDFELNDAITELLEEGVIQENDNAYGVAQQVIYSGYNSLSPKQRVVYDKSVVPLLEGKGAEPPR